MLLPLAAASIAAWLATRKPAIDPTKLADARSAFAAKVYNVAAPVCARFGVPVSLAIAQAAVETGWGRAVPGGNLYGLKGKGPAGSVNVPTKEEFAPGEVSKIRDNFRAFNNWAQSVEAWCRYVTASRNRPPVANPSAASWLVWYWSQGYATASRYPAAVASVSRSVAKRLGRPDLAIVLDGRLAEIALALGDVSPKQRRKQAQALAAAKNWPA